MSLFDSEQYKKATTVAGRVAAIEDTNSPLMQRAKTRATQQANQLGLRNSSIAVGAAQNAVLDAATPIATSDTTIAEGARQFGESLGLERDKFKENTTQFGKQLGESQRQFDAGQGQQMKLAKMDADNRLALANIQYDNQADIAGNENISRAWGTTMDAINQLQNNPDLDASTKKTLIANQVAGFQSFTSFWKKATGGTVDVSDLLKFGVTNTDKAPAKATTPKTPAGGSQAPSAKDYDYWAQEMALSGGTGA